MVRSTVGGIIASYNQAAFIEEAVASLAHQVDEVVVVDDHSSDDTALRVTNLRLANVRLISLAQQGGVSAAFNRAVEESSAEILLIQGGDDRSLPGRAATQRRALDDSGVALAVSTPAIMGSDGVPLPSLTAQEFAPPELNQDPLAKLFFSGNFICAPSAAMRRADYLRWGGFAVGVDLLQDYGLWLNAVSHGHLVWSHDPLVVYRKHPGNTSRSYVGIDSVRRRRHAAEREYLLSSFVESADSAIVSRLAAYAGLAADLGSPDAVDVGRALVMLSHGERAVQRRGLHLLFGLVGKQTGAEAVRAAGVGKVELDSFAQMVDHDATGDINRALRVAGETS